MKGLVFTYTLTYGGALAALFRPYLGLLIYVAFAILCPEDLWSLPAGNYSRIVAVGLLAGWGLNGFGGWWLGRAGGLAAALVGFLTIWATEGAASPDPELGLGGVEDLAKVVVAFVAGATLITSVRQLKQLAWVVVLCQGYLAYRFNEDYLNGSFNEAEFRFRGMDNNGMAITMVTSAGLAIVLGMHAARWWAKVAALATAALMAHFVLFSMSRGGMLAMAICGLLSFLLIPKEPRHYAAFLIGALLVLRMAGPGVRKEFSTSFAAEEERDASAGMRTKHWKACVASMLERPLGIGPDHWPLAAPEYGLPAMEAHTTWLQLGAEMGLPGLGCIALFYGLCLGRLWPVARGKVAVADPWLRHLACATVAALVGFIVAAQFVTSEGLEIPYFVALIGAGVLKLTPAGAASRGGWSAAYA